LSAEPGSFLIQTLPLRHADDLFPGTARLAANPALKLRDAPLQISQLLFDQFCAHRGNLPSRPSNRKKDLIHAVGH
jgi:hypothetical protein